MNHSELIKSIIQLRNLGNDVIKLNIPSHNKEKILNVIEFESHLLKREIINDLGSQALEKLEKEERNKSK